MSEPLDWIIDLKEGSHIRNLVIEFDDGKFILKPYHIKSILSKLCMKGVALSIENKKNA